MFKRLRRRHDARHSASSGRTRLEVCTSCRSEYVHPVEWSESGDEHWWMLLRCGECHREHEVTVGDGVATRFNTDLDAAQREIGRAARSLDEERMADEIEVFAQALQRDLIDAVDFAPRIDQR
jgi:hypothetical protein